ncbi:thiol-disulfide oxidoreductase DCC family protein [Haloarcula brevis]|uniref:thiol-disulfide oxidoreductase DCC family protein n=1 Tax=Haloarcula brevis TaxID=3111453 RepID=UPI00300F4C27
MSDATLVYDDDCGFCTWWADFIGQRSDLDIVGFSELDGDLLERLPDDYETCSHLVTDEDVYSCGESIETALTHTDLGEPARPLVSFLRQFEDYERLRERAYRRVAENRSKWGKVMSKTPPARRDGSD